MIDPHAMGAAARYRGKPYENPYQPHDKEFALYAAGWSRADGEIYAATQTTVGKMRLNLF